MMKEKRRDAVGLAAIATGIVLWSGVLAWRSWQPSETPQQQQRAEESAHQRADDTPLERFWNWTTHDPVTFYTFVLALFTSVLGATAIVQIRYLRKADETTRLA